MNATATLDRAGRFVLPKSVRDALRVGPGDSLEIVIEEERLILYPVRVRPALQKELGVWVYRSGATDEISIPDLIDRARDRRTGTLLGGQR